MRSTNFEIKVSATPEQVWEMLTTADGLATWFGTEASIDFEIGGSRTIGWAGVVEMTGKISEIEHLKRLVIVYESEHEVGTEEWILESDGSTTHLRLIHSMPDDGIDDWDGFYGDMSRGWTLFLASMKFALEDADTKTRDAQAAYPQAADRAATWEQIKSIIASSDDLLNGMETRTIIEPHSIFLTAPDRTLIIDQEGQGPVHMIYIQASSFGVDASWQSDVLSRFSAAGTD